MNSRLVTLSLGRVVRFVFGIILGAVQLGFAGEALNGGIRVDLVDRNEIVIVASVISTDDTRVRVFRESPERAELGRGGALDPADTQLLFSDTNLQDGTEYSYRAYTFKGDEIVSESSILVVTAGKITGNIRDNRVWTGPRTMANFVTIVQGGSLTIEGNGSFDVPQGAIGMLLRMENGTSLRVENSRLGGVDLLTSPGDVVDVTFFESDIQARSVAVKGKVSVLGGVVRKTQLQIQTELEAFEAEFREDAQIFVGNTALASFKKCVLDEVFIRSDAPDGEKKARFSIEECIFREANADFGPITEKFKNNRLDPDALVGNQPIGSVSIGEMPITEAITNNSLSAINVNVLSMGTIQVVSNAFFSLSVLPQQPSQGPALILGDVEVVGNEIGLPTREEAFNGFAELQIEGVGTRSLRVEGNRSAGTNRFGIYIQNVNPPENGARRLVLSNEMAQVISIQNVTNIEIFANRVDSFGDYGLRLNNVSGSQVASNHFVLARGQNGNDPETGIYVGRQFGTDGICSSNVIWTNLISGFDVGVTFDLAESNAFFNNVLLNSGISLVMGSTFQPAPEFPPKARLNLVFNNYFSGRRDFFAGDHCGGNVCPDNVFFLLPAPGSNIVGGVTVAGNFWSNFSGPDENLDGIIDVPYPLGIGPVGANYVDQFPLSHDIIVNTEGDESDADPNDLFPDVDLSEPGLQTTLRAAMEFSERKPGPDRIIFNIDVGPTPTINVGRILPDITQEVTIDGSSQPRANLVLIDGAGAVGAVPGIRITGGPATLRGLAVTRFPTDGVEISGGGSNRIQNCFIGTDDRLSTGLGNGGNGVLIRNSQKNEVGGAAVGVTNYISGNNLNGVHIESSRDNLVAASSILENKQHGVLLSQSHGNRIGRPNPNPEELTGGNLISGNGFSGVSMAGGLATNNVVIGNFIGTLSDGLNRFANGQHGVELLFGTTGNTIGGVDNELRNVISGNKMDGVHIEGSNAKENIVVGNFIGVTARGDEALGAGRVDPGNGGNGVMIEEGSGNIIGTSIANVISGNTLRGIFIRGATAKNNRIQGNLIGVDKNGATAIPNLRSGIVIDNAPENIIGGVTVDLANTISGNMENGVRIIGPAARGNRIIGNSIGLDSDAANAAPNEMSGVLVQQAAENFIGGAQDGAGNVIGGNKLSGIEILGELAQLNRVQNNFIGTDASGALLRPNLEHGVRIHTAAHNNFVDAGNLISGNTLNGVLIEGGQTQGNVVAGNFVGVDPAGAVARPNGGSGIVVDAAIETIVGGRGASDVNLISGNASHGVLVQNGSQRTRIEGNRIGTIANLGGRLPNGGSGVLVQSGAIDTLIGAGALGAGNTIAGNAGNGIEVADAATSGTTIQGNLIGSHPDLITPLSNGANGVLVNRNASSTTIGGLNASVRNTIAFNGAAGVFAASGLFTKVLGNSIFSNGALGIDLAPVGVTENDVLDADGGPNRLQNFPVITQVLSGVPSVSGHLDSEPSKTYRLEFFMSPAADPSGNGEGRRFLGAFEVITDVSGRALFDRAIGGFALVGQFVTATATDLGGNTSEISDSAPVTARSAAIADLAISQTFTPSAVVLGNQYTVELTVTNLGSGLATSVTVTNFAPEGAAFVSSSASATEVDGRVAVLSLGEIPPGGVKREQIKLLAAQTGSLENVATVAAAEVDPVLANNETRGAIRSDLAANFRADLGVSLSAQPAPNGRIKFDVRAANEGPDPATRVTVTIELPPLTAVHSGTVPIGSLTRRGTTLTWSIDSFERDSNFTAQFEIEAGQCEVGIFAGIRAAEPDPTAENNSAIATISVPADAGAAVDLELDHALGPDPAVVDGLVEFRIWLVNATSIRAAGALVTIQAPVAVSILSVEAPGAAVEQSPSGAQVSFPCVSANSEAEIIVRARVNAVGPLAFQASLSSVNPDPAAANNILAGQIFAKAPTLVVTSAADSGPGSFRQALLDANASAAEEIISFAIGGGGTPSIRPLSALPAVSRALLIDASTEASGRVEISGADTGFSTPLTIRAAEGADVRFLNFAFCQTRALVIEQGAGNLVRGCWFGPDSTGLASSANASVGMRITGSVRSLIGGRTTLERNLFGGNGSHGMEIINASSAENRVVGNWFGLGIDGDKRLPNISSGLSIVDAAGSVVGGPRRGERNIFANSGLFGIGLDRASLSAIHGNWIGVTRTGRKPAGNSSNGINLNNSHTNQVMGNLVGGSGFDGLSLAGSSHHNVVVGNILGLDASGQSTNSNRLGISLFNTASLNQIGGPSPADRNVVSGNRSSGIQISSGVSSNSVKGNYIGVDVTGLLGMGNAANGILVANSQRNSIGGVSPGEGNVVAGNLGDGVDLSGPGSSNNVVVGNLIGLNQNAQPLGNLQNGITIFNASDDLVVSNRIAFNSGNGIQVYLGAANPQTTLRNRVSRNSIFANGALPVDLGGVADAVGDGPDDNDLFDADDGPNGRQNSPTLALAGGSLRIDLQAQEGSVLAVELFANRPGSQEFIGEVVLPAAPPSGLVQSTVPLPVLPPGTTFLSATATDIFGNTSEFSSSLSLDAAPPTAPEIFNLRAVNGRLAFSVRTENGRRYRVEASINLVDWTGALTFVASDAISEFEDALPGPFTAGRYFRVLALPD